MKDGGPSNKDASASGGASTGGSTTAGSSGGSSGGDAATGSGGNESGGANSGGAATGAAGGSTNGGATSAASDAGDSGPPTPVDAGPPPCAPGTVSCANDPSERCTDIRVRPDHCGACDTVCAGTGTLTVACASGSCSPTCDTAHADCNKDGTDGCEIDVKTDPKNCGACGHDCSTNGASSTTCVAGVCTPKCTTNRADCSTPNASTTDDGCETDLNSSDNCGACGRDCQGGGCAKLVCTPLDLSTTALGPFAVDAKYVHFATSGGVTRVAVNGSTPVLVGLSSVVPVGGIAADGTYVYYSDPSDAGSADPPNGFIVRVPSGGTITTVPVPSSDPRTIAVAGTYLYWTDGSNNTLHRAGLDGGDPTTVETGFAICPQLTTNGKYVFAADENTLAGVPVEGGPTTVTPTTITPAVFSLTIAIDETNAYFWTTSGTSNPPTYSLAKLPQTLAGNPVKLVDSTLTPPNAALSPLAADRSFVYFEQVDGLYRIAPTGGTAVRLVAIDTANEPIHSIVAFGGAVYWVAGQTLSKLAVFPN